MIMKYSWILFDLDNTIYDFDASSDFALRKTFNEFDINDNEENIEKYKEINRQCWMDFENGLLDFQTVRNIRFELFVQKLNLNIDPIEMTGRYLQLLSNTDFEIDGARDILDFLKPYYKMAVVTNGLKEVKRPQLSRPGIASYFAEIVISEEVGIAKPHNGFFEHTFERIGQPSKSKVIIIGDNLHSDIKGGKDYGIDTCWFNLKSRANDTEIRPTYEIGELAELKKILG